VTQTVESHGSTGFAPRIWMGCTAGAWLRLLWRNGFAVDFTHLYFAGVDSLTSQINSVFSIADKIAFGRRLRRFKMRDDPFFIIGHWRTGTTLLQELLALDPRNVTPTTYQCFAPSHFLATESFLPPLLKPLLPKRRPMDGMPMSFTAPFEDEFALVILGLPSPYESVVFPNRDLLKPERFDVGAKDSAGRREWMKSFSNYCKRVCLNRPQARLVLKSPPHTCRIKTLLEIFPNARFVYMTRDPFETFPSTVHLWRTLFAKQGLQRPKYEGLEGRVFECFMYLHECFERDRALIPSGRLTEISFESLVADPLATIRKIYGELLEEDFDPARPAIERRLADRQSHSRNRYALSDEDRERIRARWRPYFLRHGYPLETPSSP
jgi:omega-hydroxy-beta-dihydromenaquinone-9 sulfotransferase